MRVDGVVATGDPGALDQPDAPVPAPPLIPTDEPRRPDSGAPVEAPATTPVVPASLEPAAPVVSLGFADGESVALADDDPRVGPFRAAAAAMLGDAPAAGPS